jgi:predicted nucleotidyltransferase component of viral defense system
MLNISKHEIILKQVLRDIFKHDKLQGQLAFKGGTCLYIFYGLNRFSTDLDFNLVSEQFDFEEVTKILKKYITIEDFSSKSNTWFWLGSYEKGLQKIKIEVSKRDYPDKFKNMNYYGILIPTMAPEYMFAHKLCAITDRKKLQNRDLFDAWFMFDKQWEPNEDIIKLRTGKAKIEYFKDLVQFIENKVEKKNILDGLGEVINEKQKPWVKGHLIEDLLFQLGIRIK